MKESVSVSSLIPCIFDKQYLTEDTELLKWLMVVMLVQVTVSVFAVAECWGGGGGCSVLCVSLGQPTQLINTGQI